jgi:H+/Cl- antiporter ClcA
MREFLHRYLWPGERSLLTLLRWMLVSGLTGVACGLVGAAFYYVVSFATTARQTHGWLLFCLPLAGLFIVWSYRVLGMENDSGTNQIIASVRNGEKPPLRLAILIFVSTALTHLTGGSAGREGAALQIGGSLAASIGRLLLLDERNMNLIVMCGMSAVFTALFGTPLSATVFSLEVVSVGIVHYSALFPCLLASLVTTEVTRLLGIRPEGYVLMGGPELNWQFMLRTGLLAIACALLSMAFCVLMHKTNYLYKKYFPDQYLRVLAGAAILIVLTQLVGSRDYNGAGGDIIEEALAGHAVPYAFLLKMIFTALTLGAGFRGGEIVPTFFVGATFGCAAAPLLGLDPAFGGAIGMIALFCGVTNCPLASIFLSIELFGSSHILFFALACALSYLLSGKFSLYSAQKIVYSKLEPRFIDENAH